MTENTLRVLIIDDEPAIRKLLKISMQAYGYEPVSYTHLTLPTILRV